MEARIIESGKPRPVAGRWSNASRMTDSSIAGTINTGLWLATCSRSSITVSRDSRSMSSWRLVSAINCPNRSASAFRSLDLLKSCRWRVKTLIVSRALLMRPVNVQKGSTRANAGTTSWILPDLARFNISRADSTCSWPSASSRTKLDSTYTITRPTQTRCPRPVWHR